MAEVQKSTESGEMTQIFIEFVMMQAQNAALFLGQAPNPGGGQPEINLPLAKLFIDQLAVLRVKTHGNLTKDEQEVIDSAITQLQLAFVEVSDHVGHDHLKTPFVGSGPARSQITPGPGPTPPAAAEPKPAEAAPPVEPPQESRKLFTKSYGS